MSSRVDAVSEHAHRSVEALGLAADLRDRGICLQLAVLPDQDLLVIPSQADADVGQGREAVGILREQVLTHRLHAVHDLGEPVVVVGRLDERGVIVPGGGRRAGHVRVVEEDGELDRREERPFGRICKTRDPRRVAGEEAEVTGRLRRVVAPRRQVDVDEAAVLEQPGVDREGRLANQP